MFTHNTGKLVLAATSAIVAVVLELPALFWRRTTPAHRTARMRRWPSIPTGSWTGGNVGRATPILSSLTRWLATTISKTPLACSTTTSHRAKRSSSEVVPNMAQTGKICRTLRGASCHGLTEGHDEIVGDKVASTTLGFVGLIDRLDGDVIAFDGRSQLGWVCDSGEWKIRHELNYAGVVEPEEIAPFLDQPEAQ